MNRNRTHDFDSIPPFSPHLESYGTDDVVKMLQGVSKNVFEAFMNVNGIGVYHMETYEKSIEEIYAKIRKITLKLTNTTSYPHIGFTDPVFEKSEIYPSEAIVKQLHYIGKLKATPFIQVDVDKKYVSKGQITLCQLPIMVRSKYCLTKELFDRFEMAQDENNRLKKEFENENGNEIEEKIRRSTEELAAAGKALNEKGIDSSDPGKYFIMGGVRRIILTTERLRMNQAYAYGEDGDLLLSSTLWSTRPITSNLNIYSNGTTLNTVLLLSSSIWNPGYEKFSRPDGSDINVIKVIRMLGVEENVFQEVFDRTFPVIASSTRKMQMQMIRTFLETSCRGAYEMEEDDFFDDIHRNAFKATLYKNHDHEFGIHDTNSPIHEKKRWVQRFVTNNIFSNFVLAGQFLFGDVQDSVIKVHDPSLMKDVHSRVYTIMMMILRYCLVRLGFRAQDSRDSWANKRLILTGERFTTQFHHSFMRTVLPDGTAKSAKQSNVLEGRLQEVWEREALSKTDYMEGRQDIGKLFDMSVSIMLGGGNVIGYECQQNIRTTGEDLASAYAASNNLTCVHPPDVLLPVVLEDYWKAFKKKGWGVFGIGLRGSDGRGSSSRSWTPDATDTLDVDQNDLHINYQLSAITVRSNDNSKTIAPRLVHESQAYFVCPVVTPEGENVGLTKQIAVGTKVSLGRTTEEDTNLFFNLLNIRTRPEPTAGKQNTVYQYWDSMTRGLTKMFYNGCFIGMVEGISFREFLQECRVKGTLWWDMSVYFDADVHLQVCTEASRLLRPVFTMDQESGSARFILDKDVDYLNKKYLDRRDYRKMIEKGYITWIDAAEQSSGFVVRDEGGVYKRVSNISDFPKNQSFDTYKRPLSGGVLIADGIWDVYHAKTRARYILAKIEFLTEFERNIRDMDTKTTEMVRQWAIKLLKWDGTTEDRKIVMEQIDNLFWTMLNFEERTGSIQVGNGLRFRQFPSSSLNAYVPNLNLDPAQFLNSLLRMTQEELSNAKLSRTDVLMRSRFTHCAIHPSMLLSATALVIPYVNHIHGPRANLASKFNRQTLRGSHTNQDILMPNEVKILNRPDMPLVKTSITDYVGVADHPTGNNVVVAVGCFEGVNQEDSLVFNRASLERGLFSYTRYYSEHLSKDTVEEASVFGSKYYGKGPVKRSEFIFGVSSIHTNSEKFRHISKVGGLPKPGTLVKPKDCLISAYERVYGEGDVINTIDRSVYVNSDGAGIVDRVTVTKNFGNTVVVTVRVRQSLSPIVGDKFASRHAQKCTIGRVEDVENLPFTSDGVIPDIIMNPHALPNRMTVGQVIEMVAGKAALLHGERVVADAFDTVDMDKIIVTLRQYGYETSGKETLYNGMTGEMYDAKVLIGPCYYQPLKHQVKFKQQTRGASGARDAITMQASGGRTNGSGTRQGVMEKAILSMVPALEMHQCMVSDAFPVNVCQTCNAIVETSDVNPETGVCKKVACRACNSYSQQRYETFKTTILLETSSDTRQTFIQVLSQSFLRNLRDHLNIKESYLDGIPAFVNLKDYIMTMDPRAATINLFLESVRKAFFPMAVDNKVLEISERSYLDSLVKKLEEAWGMFYQSSKDLDYIIRGGTADMLRPIAETTYKVKIVPHSTLVFMRYMTQMGFDMKMN